ncbi:uncharacterized protein M421DRAFT_8983 [Didymella exigua CBS 183.55]|uniref:RNase H type-1 domain-containing protein n=1 Tax=Didymella exigua CBS 183.55 TaxID=1150837 RepID=A0A6A5RAC7_9PLEO|nr:uncharacterized protein M421DRAFT_8983 [Didymella exigua CBS 183.55]KAF1924148.1 hypothetical protein M421DRAFT_8983 [Didymella exigua CBS 183.55]
MFKPLSTAYSKELTTHLHSGQGLSVIKKSDFFHLFWKAWTNTFTPELILRSFKATVIWCLRGDAPPTSQWAFLECHSAMETHDVSIKWAPGHLGIEGNEAADRLANLEAQHPSPPTGIAAMPTLSGIKTIARKMLQHTQQTWWSNKKTKLSKWYKS